MTRKKDAQITDNSFTQAVKKAAKGGESVDVINKKDHQEATKKELKAQDELMRAKEARNDTTGESEQFRRDES